MAGCKGTGGVPMLGCMTLTPPHRPSPRVAPALEVLDSKTNCETSICRLGLRYTNIVLLQVTCSWQPSPKVVPIIEGLDGQSDS